MWLRLAALLLVLLQVCLKVNVLVSTLGRLQHARA
jgi:hypothetical protein